MKVSVTITLCLTLFTASAAVFATHTEQVTVSSTSAKDKNEFVLRVNKTWKNAHVEVLALNGECIACQTIERRRLVIDFSKVKPGTYTVRISKGEEVQEFKYQRN